MPETPQPPRRLVIFEGIMGSGKTSSTRWLGKRLADQGLAVHVQTEGTYPHPLRAIDTCEDPLKPWLDTTAAQLAARRLALWQTFVDKAVQSGTVNVVDGQLFHGDLTSLFLMEMPEEEMALNVQDLARVIAPLRPLVVYYHQADVRLAIHSVAAERGEALGVKHQTEWKLKFPYAVRRGLAGLEGLADAYVGYRAVTDRLFGQLPLDKLAIENQARDWAACYSAVERAFHAEPGVLIAGV